MRRLFLFLVIFIGALTCAGRDCVARDALSSDADADAKSRERFAMTHEGDVARGKKLFNKDLRTRCLTCHQVGKEGGKIGPDLSKIGGKFDRIHLIESLLEPSRQIVQGYETRVIVKTDGDILAGIVTKESDQQLVLEAAADKRWEIAKSDIEESKVSKVSTMPSDLAKQLSDQEFTDLIAYLETLRTGGNKFGAGTKGPVRLPDGYKIETLVTGLSGATAMQVLDDGRILICEQDGRLRVVKDDRLLDQPMLTLDVEHNWERGLIGVTVHPQFPTQDWVYVCYVVEEPFSHHRISRFRVTGDVADPASEDILFEGDDQSQLGGHVPAGHQGGAMHFGIDGKLYVGIGEQTAGTPAQSLETLQGKILCLNDDGSIPVDNPFVSQTDGKYQAIWALGCRNPFTFAIDQSTGQMLINDVGGKFEEINPGVAGANYGWPTANHGPSQNDEFTGPIHHYPEASISGGDFAPDAVGDSNAGRYFFADFVHGWIKTIDPQKGGKASDFVAGLRRPVDLRFASDGSLYVLLRNAWVVDDKFQTDSGSLVRISNR